jgi:predicted acylesterase/phospholipase RssA
VRGVAHIGVMKALRHTGLIQSVKEVIGISAGSLFALLWVLEYSIEQIERLATELDFTVLRNIDPESVLMFPVNYGLDDGKGVDKLLVSILKQKGFGPDATFGEVGAVHRIGLRCFATELQSCSLREFGTWATPGVSVRFALRASMALPIVYTPMVEPGSGALLVDGGVLNNLPLVFMSEADIRDTVCVFFSRWKKDMNMPINTIMDMCSMLFDATMLMKSLPFIEKYREKIIVIQTDDFSVMNLEEPRDSRVALIQKAYDKTMEFLLTPCAKAVRRYSAC